MFDGFELKEYDAEKAQEAIDKQKARAKEAADRPPRKRGAATLFVANLPFRYSDDDVVALFAEVAPITSAQVVMDDDGRSRGYGFVDVSAEIKSSRRVSRPPRHRRDASSMASRSGLSPLESACATAFSPSTRLTV